MLSEFPMDPPRPAASDIDETGSSGTAADPTFPCPICGEELQGAVKKCRHCGEWIERDCEVCHTPLRGVYAARGICVACSTARHVPAAWEPQLPEPSPPTRSRGVAALLSLFLGGLGIHRFYLGRPLSGIFYLVFFWTLIPTLIAIVEALRLGLMSEADFRRMYD